MPHKRALYFKLFLGVYGVFLLLHARSLHWQSLPVIIAAVAGLVVALAAHSRHGYWTIILLIVHMMLEWSHYAEHWWAYTNKEYVLYGVHTVLDGVFLWLEARAHFKRHYPLVIAGTVIVIATVVVVNFQTAPSWSPWLAIQDKALSHEGHVHGGILGPLVFGGIAGCLISHLRAPFEEL